MSDLNLRLVYLYFPGVWDEKGFCEFCQSAELHFHLNTLLWWRVFNLEKNRKICGIIPSNTYLVNALLGTFLGSRIIPYSSMKYASNTVEVIGSTSCITLPLVGFN
jgi:hypothetical protein